jgi:hypothetical protein
MSVITLLAIACVSHTIAPVSGDERITINITGVKQQLVGQTLVEAQDGGILFESVDRQIRAVQPDELLGRKKSDSPFEPLSREQLKIELLAELPAGFEVYDTSHYVIAHNTSKAYAQWCGALYERLHGAFYNYWQRRGMELHETPPLVAVVFQDRASFEKYGKAEMDQAVKAVIGFYSLRTNRITTYDLTGVDQSRGNSRSLGNVRKINQALLANPEAERTVATVIHEATHQLVFNSGMQTRFADIPVWLSEGLAIYFETPDLRSSRGWRTIGAVNRIRLAQLQSYLANRPADSLKSLIVDDSRFHNTRSAEYAYAEAWALCYVLQKQYPREFDEYLKRLQTKKPLESDSPESRLDLFQSVFGPLEEIETRFVKSVVDLR